MSRIRFTQIATPSTPPSTTGDVYVSNDASPLLKLIDPSGTVTSFSGDTAAATLQNKTIDTTSGNVIKLNGNTITSTAGTAVITLPNVTDTLVNLTSTQAITGVKTMTNPTMAAGTTGVPSMTITAGTAMTTPTAGVVENDGVAIYQTSDITNGRAEIDKWNIFRLAANGSAISTIADVFGTNDGIPTVLNGVYEIEWHCYGTVATGGTATWTIVNTQTVTNMVADYLTTPIAGLATTGTATMAGVITQTAASVALPVTGSLSAASHYHKIHAVIEAATAGNVRLRLTMSAGTWTPLRDSFLRVRRLAAGNVGTFVA